MSEALFVCVERMDFWQSAGEDTQFVGDLQTLEMACLVSMGERE